MNVSLSPQLERMIEERIASGRYGSASEVIQEALQVLEDRERLQGLRRQAAEGLESLERDEVLKLDEAGLKDYLQQVDRRGRERRSRVKGVGD
jgi:antitoxin ParD1/3/4